MMRGREQRLAIGIVCLLLCLFSSFAWAQGKGYGVEVRARSPLQISTKPGRIISVSVLITSFQTREETFIEEIKLPEGWQPLVPPGRFSIPAYLVLWPSRSQLLQKRMTTMLFIL